MSTTTVWQVPQQGTGITPAAVAPIIHQVAGMLFMAGQIGLEPASMTLVPGGLEAEQAQVSARVCAWLCVLHA